MIFGYKRADKLAHFGGQGFHLCPGHIANVFAFQIELEMLSDQAEVIIVIVEGGVEIIPRLVQAFPSGVIEHVFVDKPVIPNVLYFEDELIVLGYIKSAVEWFGDRIFVGRSWFAMGIWGQDMRHLHHTGFELFIAFTGWIAEQCAGWNSAGTSVFTIGKSDAINLVAIGTHFGFHQKFNAKGTFRHDNFKANRFAGSKIVRADGRAIGAVAKVEELGCFRTDYGA